MKTIKYEINGKQIDIEVTEEFAKQFEKIQADDMKQNWRNKKRKDSSFDAMLESGYQAEDPNSNIEELFVQQCDLRMLYKAIESLEPQQKWLIQQVFNYGRKQSDVAAELGINPVAVWKRLQKIYKKKKKIFQRGG